MEHPLGLGGGSRFSDISRELLANPPEKAFNMSEFSALFPHLLMGWIVFEKGAIRFPKITEALLLLVPFRNLVPKPDTGPCRPVSNHERNNLPGSAAQRHPEPPLIGPAADVGPALVKFENIAVLRRLDLLS